MRNARRELCDNFSGITRETSPCPSSTQQPAWHMDMPVGIVELGHSCFQVALLGLFEVHRGWGRGREKRPACCLQLLAFGGAWRCLGGSWGCLQVPRVESAGPSGNCCPANGCSHASHGSRLGVRAAAAACCCQVDPSGEPLVEQNSRGRVIGQCSARDPPCLLQPRPDQPFPDNFPHAGLSKLPSTPLLNLPSRSCNPDCNCFPSTPRGDTIPDKMFRTALRQSTRAVGALAASSRVAAVSALFRPCSSSARPTRSPNSIHPVVLGCHLNPPCTRPRSSIELRFARAPRLPGRPELWMGPGPSAAAAGALLGFRLG